MSASSMTRLPVVRNKSYKLNGLKSYVYAMNKFGIAPTQPSMFSRSGSQSKLMKVQEDGTSGEVTANDQQNDSFYTVDVQIGTPPQTVSLDFDSGSSDLWVWSTKLNKSTLAAGEKQDVKVFDSSKSSTFKNTSGSTWKISYGDGSGASGSVGTDNVTIGNITIKNQSVELASKVSSSFQNQSSSGLLGLAWGSINTVQPTPVKTPVENMIAEDEIPTDAELFTVYLGSVKDVNDADKGESFYTFGQIDQDVVTASGQSIGWTPIDNSEGFWNFPSTSAVINGTTINLSGNTAIADTGTTLMLVSDQLCNAIYADIPGAKNDQSSGGWILPADNVSARPTIQVAVGSTMITIEKEQLGWQAIDGNTSMVFGGIQSRGTNPFDIFGDVFLICCYAIFDVGQKRFGVVQRPDPTPSG